MAPPAFDTVDGALVSVSASGAAYLREHRA